MPKKKPLRLFHYSVDRPICFHNKDQYGEGSRDHLQMKPRGFWMSPETNDGWLEWVQNEMPYWSNSYRYRVEARLKPGNNVLTLNSVSEILAFTDKYSMAHERLALQKELPAGANLSFLDGYVDWRRVAKDYQGIMIVPYQWGCRMSHKTSWYYGWDCASACVWDMAALEIVSIEPFVLMGVVGRLINDLVSLVTNSRLGHWWRRKTMKRLMKLIEAEYCKQDRRAGLEA